MAAMDDEAREAFLSEARVAVLSTPSGDRPPLSVPIWFEWAGGRARFFTSSGSPKMRRLTTNPQASLLVANPTGMPEAWVLIQGAVEVSEDGAFALAERLAHRYWDMNNSGHAQTVEDWRAGAATLRVVEIVPNRIRSSG